MAQYDVLEVFPRIVRITMTYPIPSPQDLPLELFRLLLLEAIRARSLKRAPRLRLVNREQGSPVPNFSC